MHALIGSIRLYKLENDKCLELNAVKQPQFIAPATSSVSASLFHEVLRPLQIKAPARGRPKLIELSDERKALSRARTAAEVEPCPKEQLVLF